MWAGALAVNAGIAQLAVGVGDVLLLLGNFFVELFAFGGDVDFAFVDDGDVECEPWSAWRGRRRSGRRSGLR